MSTERKYNGLPFFTIFPPVVVSRRLESGRLRKTVASVPAVQTAPPARKRTLRAPPFIAQCFHYSTPPPRKFYIDFKLCICKYRQFPQRFFGNVPKTGDRFLPRSCGVSGPRGTRGKQRVSFPSPPRRSAARCAAPQTGPAIVPRGFLRALAISGTTGSLWNLHNID